MSFQGIQLLALFSMAFYLASLALPVLYRIGTNNEWDSSWGLTALLLGGLNFFFIQGGGLLGATVWLMNFIYFLGIVEFWTRRETYGHLVPILLILGSLAVPFLIPAIKVIRDEAGNTDNIVLLRGGQLWLCSMLFMGIALSMQKATLPNIVTIPVALGLFCVGLVVFGLSIRQWKERSDLSLNPAVEFSDPATIAVLQEWNEKSINANVLAERLGSQCDIRGRFGLTPLSYFVIRQDAQGVKACLRRIERQTTIPKKYGLLKQSFWEAEVVPSVLQIQFGREGAAEMLNEELIPKIMAQENFFQAAGFGQNRLEQLLEHMIIGSKNFREFYKPESGPVSPRLLDFSVATERLQNPKVLEHLLWLMEVSPQSFTQPVALSLNEKSLSVAEGLLQQLEESSLSPELVNLRERLLKFKKDFSTWAPVEVGQSFYLREGERILPGGALDLWLREVRTEAGESRYSFSAMALSATGQAWQQTSPSFELSLSEPSKDLYRYRIVLERPAKAPAPGAYFRIEESQRE